TVAIATSDSGEGLVSSLAQPTPAASLNLVFGQGNWNVPRTVTVTGQNDTVTDPAHPYQINVGPTSSTDPNYQNLSAAPVAVINDDNEPEVTIVATSPNAAEGGASGIFTVTRTGNTNTSLAVGYSIGG